MKGTRPLNNDEIRHVNDTANKLSMNGHDPPIASEKVIAMLEEQVQYLKTQLTESTEREKTLLALTDRLQKQNETLMLPPPPEKKQNWLLRLVGAR